MKIGCFLKAMFSEDSGVSSTRVMSFISLVIGAYLAIHGLDMRVDLMSLAALVGVFVGGAFGGKVWQKSIETKADAAATAAGKVPTPPPPQS